jgi:hypothetical protein
VIGIAGIAVALLQFCSCVPDNVKHSPLTQRYLALLTCRLPDLHTMSIAFSDAAGKADLSPVLTQLHQHAAGLRFLHLQLDRDWEHDAAWEALSQGLEAW